MANLTAEQLRKFVESIITQKLDKTQKFDNFFTGTILSVNNSVYDIQLSENAETTIKALSLKEEFYSKDDAVYVAKIINGLTDSYLILDKVKDLQEEFVNLTLAERFLTGDQDPFILGDLNEDGRVLGDEDSEKEFIDIIKANGTFKIAAIFSSNATTISGGLQIDLENDKNFILKSYYFLAEDFVGRPQEMTNLAQEKVFLIEEEDLKEAFTKIRFKKCGNTNSFICTDIKLISGSLIDIDAVIQVKTKIDNDKNYFSKEVPAGHENNVKVFSSVYYDGELLTLENQVQYYWLVKNDSVTSESPWYLSLAGDGWACLNRSEEADFIGGELATYPNGKIKVWDNNNNFIVFNDKTFFPNYENIIKCLIRYGDNIVSSEEFKIYNYGRESFEAKIVCEEPAEILFNQTNFALTCDVFNTNKKISESDYEFNYQWQYYDSEWKDIEGAIRETLFIYDRENLGDIAEDTIAADYHKIVTGEDGKQTFRCKVEIYKGKKSLDGTFVSEETTEEKTILSRVAFEVIIEADIEYKYYLSKNGSVGFQKKQVENTWTGDWNIYEGDRLVLEDWALADYDDVFSNMDIFENVSLPDLTYVYFTKRAIWKQRQQYQDKSEGAIVKTDYWDYPLIARQVGYVDGILKNLKEGYAIDQLNTFNQLTQDGKKQGVYHTEIGTAVNTLDNPDPNIKYYQKVKVEDGFKYIPITLEIVWTFQSGKEYYIKNGDDYELVASRDFNSTIDYYWEVATTDEEGNITTTYKKLEKSTVYFDYTLAKFPDGTVLPIYTDVEEKLFINADYIQTGTLRVAGERDGKEIEKFYASIDKEDVRIGGYTVSETELTSGNVGISSDDSNANNLSFWAGAENENKKRPFEVTHGGVLTAEDANISGNITAKSLNIENAEVKGKINADNINTNGLQAEYIQSKNYKQIGINLLKKAELGREGYISTGWSQSETGLYTFFNIPISPNQIYYFGPAYETFYAKIIWWHSEPIKDLNKTGTITNLSQKDLKRILGNSSFNITENNRISPEDANYCTITFNIKEGSHSPEECYFTDSSSTGGDVQGFKISSSEKDENFIESKYFKVNQNGGVDCTSGRIGGFHIKADHLSSGTSEVDNNWHDVMISSGYGGEKNDFCFWAGKVLNENDSDLTRPFWIKNDGTFKATKGKIAGWQIDSLGLNEEGSGLYYSQSIDDDTICSTGIANVPGRDEIAFWAGCDQKTPWDDQAKNRFYVTNYGDVVAKDISASGGKIGNLFIDKGLEARDLSSGNVSTLFQLNESGLTFLNPKSAITAGPLKIYRNENGEGMILTEGPLHIKGSTNNAYTEMAFMTDSGTTTESIPLTVRISTTVNYQVFIKIYSPQNKLLHKKTSVLVQYEYCNMTMRGEYKWNKFSVHSEELIIEPGQYESQSKDISPDSNEQGFWGTGMRIRLGNANNWFKELTLANSNFSWEGENFYTTTNIVYNNNIMITGNLVSNTPLYSLGLQDRYWKGAFLGSSTIVTSDLNKKNSVQPMPISYSTIFDKLKPVIYKYNDGDSNRFHTGFIGQDVKKAIQAAGLTNQDMAAYCEWEDKNGLINCALRYEEFIALCVDQIQKLKKRVDELEEQVKISQNNEIEE